MLKNIPQPHGWMQEDLEKDPNAEVEQTYFEIGEGDINFNTSPLNFRFNPNLKDRVKDRIQHMLEERRKKLSDKESNMDKKTIVARVMEKLSIEQPPKSWWKDTQEAVKRENKGISQDRVDKIVGDLWYNKMDDASRAKITKSNMEKFAPGRPPKKFLKEMKKKLKKQYPGYNDERLTTIAAGIWHNYDNKTKVELTKEYEG